MKDFINRECEASYINGKNDGRIEYCEKLAELIKLDCKGRLLNEDNLIEIVDRCLSEIKEV